MIAGTDTKANAKAEVEGALPSRRPTTRRCISANALDDRGSWTTDGRASDAERDAERRFWAADRRGDGVARGMAYRQWEDGGKWRELVRFSVPVLLVLLQSGV